MARSSSWRIENESDCESAKEELGVKAGAGAGAGAGALIGTNAGAGAGAGAGVQAATGAGAGSVLKGDGAGSFENGEEARTTGSAGAMANGEVGAEISATGAAEKGDGAASEGAAVKGEEAGAASKGAAAKGGGDASKPKPSLPSETWNGESLLRRSGSLPDFGAAMSLATANGDDCFAAGVNGLGVCGAAENGLAGAAAGS